MSEKQKAQIEATAYHEAGHAVAAFVTGLPVRIVRVSTDGGLVNHSSGFHRVPADTMKYDRPSLFRDRVERLIIVSMAGAEAQRIFSPKSWRRYHSLWDMDKAIDLLFHLAPGGGEELDVYFRLLQIRTKNLLHQQWRGVKALAGALIERAKDSPPSKDGWTINGTEARQIFLDARNTAR